MNSPLQTRRRYQRIRKAYRRAGGQPNCCICHRPLPTWTEYLAERAQLADGTRTGPTETYPTIEHIVPRRDGGTHHSTNTCIAHRRCNNQHGDT